MLAGLVRAFPDHGSTPGTEQKLAYVPRKDEQVMTESCVFCFRIPSLRRLLMKSGGPRGLPPLAPPPQPQSQVS